MEHPLDDPDSWQRATLETFGLRAYPPRSELVAAYKSLSELHNRKGPPTGSFQSQQPDSLILRLVRLLVFARRTFEIVRFLTPHLPISNHHSWSEWGAGFAPALLAIAPQASSTNRLTAMESAPGYIPARDRLFAAAQLLGPNCAAPAESPHFQIWAFSLDEIAQRSSDHAFKILASALEAENECLILEAGDRHHAQRIQRLRDRLAERGFFPALPCGDRLPQCPKLAQDDWCHFTLRAQPAPLTQQLMASLGRDPHRLHFSALLYRTAPTPRPPPNALQGTVLAHLPRGRAKAIVELCTPQGVERLVALRRETTAYDRLQDAKPLDLLTVQPKPGQKGDGFRLLSEHRFERQTLEHCEKRALRGDLEENDE